MPSAADPCPKRSLDYALGVIFVIEAIVLSIHRLVELKHNPASALACLEDPTAEPLIVMYQPDLVDPVVGEGRQLLRYQASELPLRVGPEVSPRHVAGEGIP